MPTRVRAAEQGDGDRVEPDAGVDVDGDPVGHGAEHLVGTREPDQGTGEQHRDDVGAADVDAGGAGGVRVLADGAEAVAERGPAQQPPHGDHGDQGQQEAEVQVVAVAGDLRQHRAVLHRERLRVDRARRLQEGLLGERVEDQVEADVVEHDRDDHLVRPGARLQQARETGPQGRGEHAGQDGDGQVQRGRQVDVDADPARRGTGQEHLAAATDVEHAGAEGQAHPEAGRDQRAGELQGLGERADRRREGVGPAVVDRAAEQGAVGARDGVSRGAEEVAGTGGDVAGRLADGVVGHQDQQRADHDREQHGAQGDGRVAGGDRAPHVVPVPVVGLVRLLDVGVGRALGRGARVLGLVLGLVLRLSGVVTRRLLPVVRRSSSGRAPRGGCRPGRSRRSARGRAP